MKLFYGVDMKVYIMVPCHLFENLNQVELHIYKLTVITVCSYNVDF